MEIQNAWKQALVGSSHNSISHDSTTTRDGAGRSKGGVVGGDARWGIGSDTRPGVIGGGALLVARESYLMVVWTTPSALAFIIRRDIQMNLRSMFHI